MEFDSSSDYMQQNDMGLGLYEAGAEPSGRMIIMYTGHNKFAKRDMADFASFPPNSLDLVRRYLTSHFL